MLWNINSSFHYKHTFNLSFIPQEKAGAKLRQGQTQNKEVIQEYIAGADSIAEDAATRDYVVMRARMMAAKSVYWNYEKNTLKQCTLS